MSIHSLEPLGTENCEKKVIIDLLQGLKSDNVSYGNLRIVNDSIITGSRKSRGRNGQQGKFI